MLSIARYRVFTDRDSVGGSGCPLSHGSGIDDTLRSRTGNRRVSGEAIDVRTGARRTLSAGVVIVAFGRLDSLVAAQSPGDTAIAPRTRSDSLVRYLCGDGASLSASISERGQSRRVTADSCPDGSPGGGARYLVLIDLVRLLER